MIAIDTNVLLRYLLADDAAQHRADNRRYLHLLTLDDASNRYVGGFGQSSLRHSTDA